MPTEAPPTWEETSSETPAGSPKWSDTSEAPRWDDTTFTPSLRAAVPFPGDNVQVKRALTPFEMEQRDTVSKFEQAAKNPLSPGQAAAVALGEGIGDVVEAAVDPTNLAIGAGLTALSLFPPTAPIGIGITAGLGAKMLGESAGTATAALERGDVPGAVRQVPTMVASGLMLGQASPKGILPNAEAVVRDIEAAATQPKAPVVPDALEPATVAPRSTIPEPAQVTAPKADALEPATFTPPPEIQENISAGPGAASPVDFEPVKQNITGIRNAITDAEREQRGLPPVEPVAKRSFGTVWDDALKKIDDDPDYQDRLITELRDKPRALTDTEDAVLLQRQIDLQNEFDKAQKAVVDAYEAGDEAAQFEASTRFNAFSDQLLDLYNIEKTSGTETGRGLNARRMMANEDFSLARMVTEKRAANQGRPLTDEQIAEIQTLKEKLDKTQAAFDEYRAATEKRIAEERTAEAVDEMRKRPEDTGGSDPTPEAITGRIQTAVKDDASLVEVGSLIQKLAKAFIRGGIKEREPLIDAVHTVLKDIIPNLSRRDTMDAISGYGQFRQLSKEAVDVQLRELKGEMQQVAKLEDMQSGLAPKKTGVERRTPSDDERALIKQVNEMKKRLGFTVTDPATQLKSALDTIKTRLRNQITDLELQISSRTKIVREKGASPTDVEVESLRARRDELKTEFDSIFGKPELTEAQRIERARAAVERSIDEYERRLTENAPATPKRKAAASPELDALRARRDGMKELLKVLQEGPKKSPEEIALQAIKTRLANRIAELTEKIANQDFTQAQRKVVPLDEEAIRLKADSERLKKEFRLGVEKDRLANRTRLEKAQDTFVKWRRGFVLSGPSTLAKLTAAAIERMTFSPMEEVIGAGIGKLAPKLEKAARGEGQFRTNAEAKAITESITTGMKDAWDVLRTGESTLDVVFGKSRLMEPSAVDFFGHLHGALKAPVKRAEFARYFEKLTAADMERGIDVTDPMVQVKNATLAYKKAERSIFLQDNRIVSAYKAAIGRLENMKSETGAPSKAGKAGATVAKVMLPIVRVPTNIVAETLEYSTGLATGSTRLAMAARNGVENLSEAEANLIMRQLKKGSIGGAFLLLGFFNPELIGGYYQHHQKRRTGDVKYGSIRFPGTDAEIPSLLLHNPLLETLQLGATIRRVADSKLKKSPDSQGITAGIIAGAFGLTEEIPFVRETMELSKVYDPKTREIFLGELAKGILVPQALSQTANWMDTDASGERVQRKPRDFIEHIETGIPGLREAVPIKPKSNK